jgi:hypothetical protein
MTSAVDGPLNNQQKPLAIAKQTKILESTVLRAIIHVQTNINYDIVLNSCARHSCDLKAEPMTHL